MRHAARVTAVLTACSVLGIAFVAAGQADPRDHKTTICHGTASDTNPYVLITVDNHALPAHFGGHGFQSAPDVYPDAFGNCPSDEEQPPS